MMRYEYKYLVSNEFIGDILSDMKPYIIYDKFARDRIPPEYTVRSIYYDTSSMECYHDKIDGVRLRKKYRIRGYNKVRGDDIIFLEIKRRYDNFISKNRAPLYYRNLTELLATGDIDRYILPMDNNGRVKDDARRFFFHCRRQNLHPSIMIEYEREAFCSRFDPSLRITFDKSIRSAPCTTATSLDDGDRLKLAFRRNFVFELKFYGSLPAWATRIIDKYQMPRLAISKYAICLDSHRRIGEKTPMASYITQRHWCTIT